MKRKILEELDLNKLFDAHLDVLATYYPEIPINKIRRGWQIREENPREYARMREDWLKWMVDEDFLIIVNGSYYHKEIK